MAVSVLSTSITDAAADAPTVRAALAAFCNLARVWRLSEREQCRLLGGIAPSTLYAWRGSGARSLAPDVLERVSYVLGIHAALHRLFAGAPDRMAERVRHPLPWAVTNGGSILERMLAGGIVALHEVRVFLEAEAGGDEAPALELPAYR